MGDHRGERGEQGGQMTMFAGPQKKNTFAESSEGLKDLLPGIPDSITLTHIAPKLPWRAVRILSLVSAAWQRAVHSREVYQARVRAGSTETLVVLCHFVHCRFVPLDGYSVPVHAVSVYSLEDKHYYQLPTIPGLKRGIPGYCQCVSLDGKVYILGGEDALNRGYRRRGCKEVYELDVAGKWEWKRCADMQVERLSFACAVKDEQIYAFGGSDAAMRKSEVYDPRADTWSSIEPGMNWKSKHQATTLGEDLVVHGGYSHDSRNSSPISHESFDLEIYHPGRNDSRMVVPDGIEAKKHGQIFLAHGKLYLITSDGVYVLNIGTDEYTLTRLHSSLYEEFGRLVTDQTLYCVKPCVARVVRGEILALVKCVTLEAEVYYTFLQSKGFGSENRELVWEKAACSLSFEHLEAPFICPIQL